MVTFGVITEIGEGDGNRAVSELIIEPTGEKCIAGSNIIVDPPTFDEKLFAEAIRFRDSGETIIDLTKRRMLLCQTPVFYLGEIMVMDSNGRTIPDGRKPSKWFVKCEYFNNVRSAVTRAREVVGGK